MINDILNFDLSKLLKKQEPSNILLISPEAVRILAEAVGSSAASAFTAKMNKSYEELQELDEQGNVKKIMTPLDLENKMTQDSDGTISFRISPEEDRWFRANQSFGSNIIGKIGFQYSNLSEA